MGEVGRYGFEALLLGPGRFDTNCSVWLEFPAIGVPDVKIAPLPLLHELRHASPMSGAEFVLGRCRAELDSIQAVLRSTHPTEAEDEIASHAPWLSAGSAMKVGLRMVFCDEDIDEEVVGFDFPDGSQIAVTVDKIYLCPVTFGPDRTRSVWGKFGHA